MKNAAEEKKARSSMSSTFDSVMNPNTKDFKLTLDQVMKQRKRTNYDLQDQEEDFLEVVSTLPAGSLPNLEFALAAGNN